MFMFMNTLACGHSGGCCLILWSFEHIINAMYACKTRIQMRYERDYYLQAAKHTLKLLVLKVLMFAHWIAMKNGCLKWTKQANKKIYVTSAS